MTPETIDRIVRLSARCARWHNQDQAGPGRPFNPDLEQEALDAWTIEEINAVEAKMDAANLPWDSECVRYLPNCPGLIWSDQVPTVPGWYWRRNSTRTDIIQLPHCGTWPRSWQQRREETLASVRELVDAEFVQSAIQRLLDQPDKSWRVEYAGPIPEPGEPA